MLMSASALAVPYDDEMGRPAPLSVRRAADQYTRLVEDCSDFTITAVQDKGVPQYLCCCFCQDGTYRPQRPLNDDANRAKIVSDYEGYKYRDVLQKATAEKSDRDLKDFEPVLARVLNENVTRPYNYEGDIQIKLRWELWSDGHFRVSEPVEATIMRIVNGLGGWKS